MSRTELNINPQVLRWAREEAGFDPAEIAEKVDVAEARYKRWEKEGKNIPLGKLQSIATTYKRQLAVFLLPEAPPKVQKPKDYRNLSPAESRFSKKLLDVLRDVNYFCEIAFELKGESYWKNRYDWMSEAKGKKKDNHSFNLRLRELLDISIEEQMQFGSESEAYRKWRLAVEDRLGILVFQFAMPIHEVEGFCLTDKLPYAIVVNSNYNYYHRIFTIFHELAHILRHQSGLCLFEKATTKQTEEWKCNEFAGSFLAPADVIEKTDDLNEIAVYASKLKISREVYLRRLKDENKISDLKFFRLLDVIKSSYKKIQKKKGAVAIKPEVKSKASRGETFYNMVMQAIADNKLSYTQASSALNLNVNRLLNVF
ncbi:MAG: XRE family transcriptional regulator [Chitinophagales bacterium]